MRLIATAAALATLPLLAGCGSSSVARDAPVPGSLTLSEVIESIERSPGFAYVKSVDYDDERYVIEYRTADGDHQRIISDPASRTVERD